MSFSLSIMSSTGYPFYFKRVKEDPQNTNLVLRFYSYIDENLLGNISTDQSFELYAGLISALFEFAKLLNHPIELLKFKTAKKEKEETRSKEINKYLNIEISEGTDVLINARTESFLNPENFETKIKLIFNVVLKKHVPISPEKRITDADEDFILRLLTDRDAKDRIVVNTSKIQEYFNEFINEYNSYGFQNLIITSFDGSPLIYFGLTEQETRCILQEINSIPNIPETQWVFRTSRLNKEEKGVIIINSGVGPIINYIHMPYHYILVTTKDAILGDSPTMIYQKLNSILK